MTQRLASHNAGRSPLGAPLRRLLAPSPPWRSVKRVAHERALLLRIGAFARSARSGGRAGVLGRLPGVACKATRRTPVPPAHAMPRDEHPSADGTPRGYARMGARQI